MRKTRTENRLRKMEYFRTRKRRRSKRNYDREDEEAED